MKITCLCGARFDVASEAMGQIVRCPSCNREYWASTSVSADLKAGGAAVPAPKKMTLRVIVGGLLILPLPQTFFAAMADGSVRWID